MKLRKVVAAATATLVMTSMLATTVFAAEVGVLGADGATQDVTGENWVTEPTIAVTLPGDLVFGINPMHLEVDGEEAPQIISGEYIVTNWSNVAVVVKADTKVEVTTDVALLTDADYETNGEQKATQDKKAIWLVQLLPTAVTVTENVPKLTVTKLAAGNTATNLKGVVLGTSATTVNFLLDAFDEASGTLTETGASGFVFDGVVDPNAAFVAGDVTVTTTFTLTAITESQKDDYDAFEDANSASDYHATVVKSGS